MFIFDLYKHQQPHRTQFYHNIPKKTGTFSFSEDFPTDYLSRMPTGSGNFRIALDTIIPFHMSFCNTTIYLTHTYVFPENIRLQIINRPYFQTRCFYKTYNYFPHKVLFRTF